MSVVQTVSQIHKEGKWQVSEPTQIANAEKPKAKYLLVQKGEKGPKGGHVLTPLLAASSPEAMEEAVKNSELPAGEYPLVLVAGTITVAVEPEIIIPETRVVKMVK